MRERLARVVGVVQDAVADDHVERFVLDRQIEDVHLAEVAPLEPVAELVLDGELETRERHVDPEDVVVVELQVLGELSGAAAALQHTSLL